MLVVRMVERKVVGFPEKGRWSAQQALWRLKK
jgi:hypothetical protein